MHFFFVGKFVLCDLMKKLVKLPSENGKIKTRSQNKLKYELSRICAVF